MTLKNTINNLYHIIYGDGGFFDYNIHFEYNFFYKHLYSII